MPLTTADADLELLAADGVTWLPLMLVLEVDRSGLPQAKKLDEALSASDANAPLSEWLEPRIQEDWFSGVGIAYDIAPGCDTFSSPGYVLPGGAATGVVWPTVADSNSPITDMAEYQGDLFISQQGTPSLPGRVCRSVGGSGVGAGAFVNSLPGLAAGEYVRGLCVAADNNGAEILYAGSSDADNSHGRLHAWNGTAWASTPPFPAAGSFGIWGRGRMAQVWWEGEDGLGGMRLVATASNRGHISYTRPGADPMLAASWIEGVRTGSKQPGGDLVAARRHVWYNGRDNLFDLDEQGNSPSLTSYTPLSQGNGLAVAYVDGYVYRSFGQGLDRVRVEQAGTLEENPGICTPGWGTRCESGWVTGWTTALLPWNGGILNAVYSLQLSRPAIFWGKDRSILGLESPNPLIWHGPFAIGNVQETVSRMLITDDPLSSARRLWVGTWSTGQNAPPKLTWISLPSAGGALSDLRGGGAHKFADGNGTGAWQPFCQLEGLPDTVGDKGSRKFVYQHTYGSLGLDVVAGTRLVTYTRADPGPAGSSWGPGANVVQSPVVTITPTTVTGGHKMQHRVDLFSPSGAGSPPHPAILDSIRSTYWRTAPDVDTWSFIVEYGDGVGMASGSTWTNRGMSVTQMTDALLGLARGDRTVMRDHANQRWAVKVKQVLPRQASLHEGRYGKSIKATLTVAVLGAG